VLGHDTPEEAAPGGGHVHEIITLGNRATGDMVRWEQCATCPETQPTTTWTDGAGNRHLIADGTHLTIPAGVSLEEWWAAHEWNPADTDDSTTYVPADFDALRELDSPHGLDWQERDQWLHHVSGDVWAPDMTDDEYLDMLRPLDDDDDSDGLKE